MSGQGSLHINNILSKTRSRKWGVQRCRHQRRNKLPLFRMVDLGNETKRKVNRAARLAKKGLGKKEEEKNA
jgi:hypothetical protein